MSVVKELNAFSQNYHIIFTQVWYTDNRGKVRSPTFALGVFPIDWTSLWGFVQSIGSGSCEAAVQLIRKKGGEKNE